MSKKYLTDESLATLIEEGKSYSNSNLTEAKSYTDSVLSNKAELVHTHEINEINELDAMLLNKANTTHAHTISDVTNLQDILDTLTENVNNKASVQLFIWEEND